MHAGGITYTEAVREFKRRFLLEVLAHHKGNQCKAAKELGMHRNTLSRTIAGARNSIRRRFAAASSVRHAASVLYLK